MDLEASEHLTRIASVSSLFPASILFTSGNLFFVGVLD